MICIIYSKLVCNKNCTKVLILKKNEFWSRFIFLTDFSNIKIISSLFPFVTSNNSKLSTTNKNQIMEEEKKIQVQII